MRNNLLLSIELGSSRGLVLYVEVDSTVLPPDYPDKGPGIHCRDHFRVAGLSVKRLPH